MKKLILILFVITLLTLLVACGDGAESTEVTTTQAPLVAIMTEAQSSYTAIYPLSWGGSDYRGEAIDHLKSLIETNSKSAIAVKSDFLAGGEAAGAYEILLGATNRPESKQLIASLRYDDYFIGFYGGKLVVAGGSDESSAKAIRHFATMFFSKEQNALILPENYSLRFDGSYPLSSLTLFGKDITKVAISHTPSAESDAVELQSGIKRLTGYTLPILASGENAEFVITLSHSEVKTELSESGITLAHTDAYERSLLVGALLETFAKKENGGTITKDTALLSAKASGKLTIVDLNVYSSGYAENAVTNRYPRLMTYLAGKNYPDILALQDVSPTWVSQFGESGEGYQAMKEVYGYVGKGRNDDNDSVKQAIFYKKDTLTLVDSGTFWLSSTPDIKSVGWDGRTRSICTWAILKHNVTGEEFAVMNTMLDPYGKNARTNGMNLILERAKEFDCPVILCGDMQNVAKNSVIKKVKASGFFDAQSIAASGDKTETATVNNAFGTITSFATKSDYIFTSYGDFKVESHEIDKTRIDEAYISNHWILYSELTLLSYQ